MKSKKEFSGPNYGMKEAVSGALKNDLDQVPDGQTLLLRPKVGTLLYEFDIYAVKKNRTIYFYLINSGTDFPLLNGRLQMPQCCH